MAAAPNNQQGAAAPFSVDWLRRATDEQILNAVNGDAAWARTVASIERHQPAPRTDLLTALEAIIQEPARGNV